jgi:hypothetical protein
VKYNARLRRLEQTGHSLARNEALRAARGEWVAYLDDDTVPFPDWLKSLHKIVDAAESDLAAVGGPTEPAWPCDPAPDHISKRWLFYLSCIQETRRRSVRQGAKVCGANLAFRRHSLLTIACFHNELGRVGDRLTGGEDTLAVRLLLRGGLEVMYEPSLKVKHRIHPQRLTEPWIRKRAFWEGVTQIAMIRATDEPFPWSLAIPKLAASAIVFGGLFFLRRNPDFLIRAKLASGALAARFNSTGSESNR